MTNLINRNASVKMMSGILFVMMVSMTMLFSSCGDDEPSKGGDDTPSGAIVTESDLAGTWTLVQNKVLYSETGSGKSDETISFSGNSSPRYRYYNVTVADDGKITIIETSASGSYVKDILKCELDGDQLVTSGGETAGTVESYNPHHSWDNLRIRWEASYSPISYGAPVVSAYMLSR